MSSPLAQPLAETQVPKTATRSRVQSIDIVRGAVMMLMAIDHIREFFNADAFVHSPTDLAHVTAGIFLTRWITHFCAPVFMFTAGLGAFLYGHRRSLPELSRFLWTRGLWLIVLDQTVVHLAFYFNLNYSLVILNILWALGCSMIALAALARLPFSVTLAVSVGMIAIHNLLDRVQAAQFGAFAPVWNLLHQLGVFRFAGRMILSAYPLIPWIGVMAAGYCCGRLFLVEPDRRQRVLVRLGMALTAAFIVLRAVNVYADPAPWSRQASPLFTFLSFLNCLKYPPSLDFLLMTLGPALLAMGLVERVRLSDVNPFIVFGRTPLFYFVLHLFVIHIAALVFAYIRYGDGRFLFNGLPSMSMPSPVFPANYGYPLWGVYAVWLGILALLYPVCRWYAGLKRRRTDWWLSYL
jgi:uncharacterized membrane protein